jgi:nucleoside-diphosphate-sugar epimerase
MKILVAGGTGVLGRPTVKVLLEHGHDVIVLARDPTKARSLLGDRVGLSQGDILDRAACERAAVGCNAVLHLATAIPSDPHPDWSQNDRIRTEGTANLLAAAQHAAARRYVQQSITFLYGDGGEQWLDETSEIRPAPFIRSAAEMEAMVRARQDIKWTIVRGGSFYGSGTRTTEQLLDSIRAGTGSLPSDRDPYLSLIHPTDMAAAVVAAVEAAPPSSVFNVVDGEPVRHGALIRYLATLLNAPPPRAGEVTRPSLRVSNRRLSTTLGWRPQFPSYREGFSAIIRGIA